MPQEIQIPRKISNQLLHLAQISPEQEVCGLIAGKDGVPTRVYPVANTDENPAQRFLLDGQQQIAAMTEWRERGEQLFAIYHSHPSSPATPSGTDLEWAAYPEALYLIISLNTKGVLEMRGFNIKDKTAEEVSLVLSEE